MTRDCVVTHRDTKRKLASGHFREGIIKYFEGPARAYTPPWGVPPSSSSFLLLLLVVVSALSSPADAIWDRRPPRVRRHVRGGRQRAVARALRGDRPRRRRLRRRRGRARRRRGSARGEARMDEDAARQLPDDGPPLGRAPGDVGGVERDVDEDGGGRPREVRQSNPTMCSRRTTSFS